MPLFHVGSHWGKSQFFVRYFKFANSETSYFFVWTYLKNLHLIEQKKVRICRLGELIFPFLQQNSAWKMPTIGAHKKCLMKLWDFKDFERNAERVAFFDACIVGYSIFFFWLKNSSFDRQASQQESLHRLTIYRDSFYINYPKKLSGKTILFFTFG